MRGGLQLSYDGQWLTWPGVGQFRATSGLRGSQFADKQCVVDSGPIPEGRYTAQVTSMVLAKPSGTTGCALAPGFGFQQIPRGKVAGECEKFWANWGYHRLRLEAADASTKKACSPVMRSGFYLHDSSKGFSHGCIEVEGKFFDQIAAYQKPPFSLTLTVHYKGQSTYGGTRKSLTR